VVRPNPLTDSPGFQRVKRAMLAMPEPKPASKGGGTSNRKSSPPAAPSRQMKDFQTSGLQLRHPDNWTPTVQGTNISITPPDGVVQGNLAYGLVIDLFSAQNVSNLDQGTSQLLDTLVKSNPAMKIVRSNVRTQVDGQPALLTEATNDSPVGGQETDTIVTVLRSSGDIQYFIQVVPVADAGQYQGTFQSIMNSVRLR
jgi:hypothetical protein